MIFKDKVRVAMNMANDLASTIKAGGVTIPPEDMAILIKYESIKLIKITTPKQSISEKLYFPTIQAKEFKGFSFRLWVDIMLWSAHKNGLKCNIGENSAREYYNKPYEYGMLVPVIVRPTDIGNLGLAEEKEVFKELVEEYITGGKE